MADTDGFSPSLFIGITSSPSITCHLTTWLVLCLMLSFPSVLLLLGLTLLCCQIMGLYLMCLPRWEGFSLVHMSWHYFLPCATCVWVIFSCYASLFPSSMTSMALLLLTLLTLCVITLCHDPNTLVIHYNFPFPSTMPRHFVIWCGIPSYGVIYLGLASLPLISCVRPLIT